MNRFTLYPQGPFSLAAAAAFLGGWAPAGHPGATAERHLHLAFLAEEGWRPAAVCLREEDGAVEGEVWGDVEDGAVAAQVARMLSLDVDGRGFPEAGAQDEVVAALQAERPGLRPVLFNSPYEAAAWAISSQRVRMAQGAMIRQWLGRDLGLEVVAHGQALWCFPAPDRLLGLESFPGLFGRKVEHLRALAEAALDDRLDAAHLRALPAEQALADLRRLPGIGPFGAELILARGAGHPDYLPLHEPRVRRAAALAYGLPAAPDDRQFAALAEPWRPYRSWACFLLRLELAARR